MNVLSEHEYSNNPDSNKTVRMCSILKIISCVCFVVWPKVDGDEEESQFLPFCWRFKDIL